MQSAREVAVNSSARHGRGAHLALLAGVALFTLSCAHGVEESGGHAGRVGGPAPRARGGMSDSADAPIALRRAIRDSLPVGDRLEVDTLPYVYEEELPELITKVNPVYPSSARRRNIEGAVFLQALVDTDGRVKEVRVVKSDPAFDSSAVDAVRQWIFKPAMRGKEPVAVWVGIPVPFKLH